MTISKAISDDGETVTISVSGNFNYRECSKLIECIESSRPRDSYEIELSAITHVDSSALGALLVFKERVNALGGDCFIINPSAVVRKYLEAAYFRGNFDIITR